MNHWVWSRDDYYKAWNYMLMKANHKKRSILINAELVAINRGSFFTSIGNLSNELGWSKNKLSNFLNLLVNDQMMVRKGVSRGTMLTICKYNSYQKPTNDLPYTKGTAEGTAQGRAEGRQTSNYKELEIIKKNNGESKDSLLKIFGLCFKKKYNVDYNASFGKDGKILKDLEKQFGRDSVEAGIGYFFDEYVDGDKFAKKRPDVGMMKLSWNGMTVKASEKNRTNKSIEEWANG
tara:strand:+ start:1149 stop:1850 length:702 start_codon:yes stop_codon:yes gene_type:complete